MRFEIGKKQLNLGLFQFIVSCRVPILKLDTIKLYNRASNNVFVKYWKKAKGFIFGGQPEINDPVRKIDVCVAYTGIRIPNDMHMLKLVNYHNQSTCSYDTRGDTPLDVVYNTIEMNVVILQKNMVVSLGVLNELGRNAEELILCRLEKSLKRVFDGPSSVSVIRQCVAKVPKTWMDRLRYIAPMLFGMPEIDQLYEAAESEIGPIKNPIIEIDKEKYLKDLKVDGYNPKIILMDENGGVL